MVGTAPDTRNTGLWRGRRGNAKSELHCKIAAQRLWRAARKRGSPRVAFRQPAYLLHERGGLGDFEVHVEQPQLSSQHARSIGPAIEPAGVLVDRLDHADGEWKASDEYLGRDPNLDPSSERPRGRPYIPR